MKHITTRRILTEKNQNNQNWVKSLNSIDQFSTALLRKLTDLKLFVLIQKTRFWILLTIPSQILNKKFFNATDFEFKKLTQIRRQTESSTKIPILN